MASERWTSRRDSSRFPALASVTLLHPPPLSAPERRGGLLYCAGVAQLARAPAARNSAWGNRKGSARGAAGAAGARERGRGPDEGGVGLALAAQGGLVRFVVVGAPQVAVHRRRRVRITRGAVGDIPAVVLAAVLGDGLAKALISPL
jgi:hypothetical protein